jgi:hypothetical protein
VSAVQASDSELFVQRMGRRGGVPKYSLLAEIARGSTSVVYLAAAQGPSEPRLVAIKMLRDELLHLPVAVETFLEQARIAARMHHPNLVETLEVGRNGLRPFQALQYVDGQPLDRIFRRAQRQGLSLSLPMLLRVLDDVLAGIDYAQTLQDADGEPLRPVHRDVGQHNVVVTYDGAVKLLDFGVAKTDPRAHVFAAGLMLRQGARGDLDAELSAIVQRAMNGDPAARYPTALAMREDLDNYVIRSKVVPSEAPELAAFLAPLFVEERRHQQEVIERQLQLLAQATFEDSSSLPLPRVAPPSATTPPPTASFGSRATSVSAGAAPESPAPSQPPPRGREGILGLIAVTGAALLGVASMFVPYRRLAGEASAPATTSTATVEPATKREPAPAETLVTAPVVRPEAPPTQSEVDVAHIELGPREPARTAPPPPPPPPRVAAHPAPVAPPAPATTSVSAIDAPHSKPVRDIFKEDPYAQ